MNAPLTAPAQSPRFSYFRAPVSNVQPYAAFDLRQVYNVVRGDGYRAVTLELRRLCARLHEGKLSKRDVQRFKARYFDYVTFSGTFTSRSNDNLLQHSGLICFDFDDISTHFPDSNPRRAVRNLRDDLLHDAAIDTALLFRSPGGDGLKWVVPIDLSQGTHAEWFDVMSCYITRTYGICPDPSGRDVARACYLSWDPEAEIID